MSPFPMQVTVQAGARVQAVADELRKHGLTLQNYASIREQTVGGFTQAREPLGSACRLSVQRVNHVQGGRCGWASRRHVSPWLCLQAVVTACLPACPPAPLFVARSARTAPAPPSPQWMSRWLPSSW